MSSGFGFSSAGGATKPVWCTNATANSVAGVVAPPELPKQDGVPGAAGDERWMPSATVALLDTAAEEDALAAQEYAKSSHIGETVRSSPLYRQVTRFRAGITGEEDEDLKAELKGAKLFVKRGENEFSTGMLGHVKLLSHRTDMTERLGTLPPLGVISLTSIDLLPQSSDENLSGRCL